MTHSQKHYDEALRKILSDSTLRVFLWRVIVEDCKVFQEDFPTSDQAYCLLAKQEIGKRLLFDAKLRNPEAVFQAEKEYQDMMNQDQIRKDDDPLEEIQNNFIETQGE